LQTPTINYIHHKLRVKKSEEERRKVKILLLGDDKMAEEI